MQPKQYAKGQSVLVRVYGQRYKWTRGTILRSTGPVSYIVKLLNGLTWRRHQDQLKSCLDPKTDRSYYLKLFLRICFQHHPALFHQNLLTPYLYNHPILKQRLYLAVIRKEHVNLHGSIHLTRIITLNFVWL